METLPDANTLVVQKLNDSSNASDLDVEKLPDVPPPARTIHGLKVVSHSELH